MTTNAKGNEVAEIVGLLVDLEAADPVYADVYRERARAHLSGLLSPAQYELYKGLQRDIDETLARTKVATMREDWGQVAALARRVEEMRLRFEEMRAAAELGAKV